MPRFPMHLAALAAACVAVAPVAGPAAAQPTERPSFVQRGDVFCTDENDYDGYLRRGRIRQASAAESCFVTSEVTRVAVIRGGAGGKSMVRFMQGPYAGIVGWTNSALPATRASR